MKKITTKITAITLMMALYSAAYAQDYCENGSYGNQFMWVESISSGPFVNDSGPFHNNYGDQDHLYIGYADYTDQVITWETVSNTIELIPGRFSHPVMNDYPTYWQLWIDLNADQTFSDDELLLSEGSLQTVIGSIDLSNLTLNSDLVTRMRLSASFSPNAPECGSLGNGEVEDYTVVITAPVQNTLLVPGQYSKIQDAVDAAMPGDRVLVNSGTYYEDIVIDKPLLLESNFGPSNTTISTAAFKHPVWVKSPDVTISGFNFLTTVRNSKAAILFDQGAHDGQVTNVQCQASAEEAYWYMVRVNMANRIDISGVQCDAGGIYGIYAQDATDLSITDVEISGHTGAGIQLVRVENAVVENNFIHHNSDGIFVGSSQQITVRNNAVNNNESDVLDPLQYGSGIMVAVSTEIDLDNNLLDNNSSAGIKIINSDFVAVTNNDSINSRNSGLRVSDSNDLIIDNNLIQDNGQFGIYLIRSDDNQFTNNEVVKNNQSLVFWTSDNNTLFGNILIEDESNQNLCLFTIHVESINNQIYANTFKYGSLDGFCGYSDESNLWHAPEAITYVYQDQTFFSQIGNYHSYGDHTDVNSDGIADQPFTKSHLNITDAFPLTHEFSEYVIEQ